ncbi:MAG: hypothetical protein C0592_00915 [Marinilabiliales bacterium]|nr:MAG: hypothetical protein C0592_00915 [Marinilabiliales bacterium]
MKKILFLVVLSISISLSAQNLTTTGTFSNAGCYEFECNFTFIDIDGNNETFFYAYLMDSPYMPIYMLNGDTLWELTDPEDNLSPNPDIIGKNFEITYQLTDWTDAGDNTIEVKWVLWMIELE